MKKRSSKVEYSLPSQKETKTSDSCENFGVCLKEAAVAANAYFAVTSFLLKLVMISCFVDICIHFNSQSLNRKQSDIKSERVEVMELY